MSNICDLCWGFILQSLLFSSSVHLSNPSDLRLSILFCSFNFLRLSFFAQSVSHSRNLWRILCANNNARASLQSTRILINGKLISRETLQRGQSTWLHYLFLFSQSIPPYWLLVNLAIVYVSRFLFKKKFF